MKLVRRRNGRERHEAIVEALKGELARFETPDGVVMDSGSWKITARNPG